MAKITVHCLVAKRTAGGIRYYWQPSATLKKAGWKAVSLGLDRAAAIEAAMARNEMVAAWRAGKASAAAPPVAPRVERHTGGFVIAEFRRLRFPQLKDNTRAEYDNKLRTIDRWMGDQPIALIGRASIEAFRDALYAPRADGRVHKTQAFNTMKVLRTLFTWAEAKGFIPRGSSPMSGKLTLAFDIAAPEPRQQFATIAAKTALLAAANALGQPNMAAAMILAWTIGQRQGDLLKLLQTRFAEIPEYEADDPAVYARLAARSPDGRVMGFRLRQGKTDRWIGVPVVGDARQQVETAIASARDRHLTTLLYDEERDRTWTSATLSERRTRQAHFQRSFAAIRARAAADATKAGDEDLAALLKGIEFRDFRRTCVVVMGQRGLPDHLIAAITGHRLEAVKKILEVYLPRTTGMAMLAVDLNESRQPLIVREA